MKKSWIIAGALGLIFVGAGCSKTAPSDELSTVPPGQAMPAKEIVSAPKAFYIAYSSGEYRKALAAKRPVVLYFWASWCPICRAEEPNIRSWVEASNLPFAGFRVNFDTESELKEKFRVAYQHTTVIIGVDGKESTRFTGPVSQDVFNAALAAAGK